jgi:hypothetical protein
MLCPVVPSWILRWTAPESIQTLDHQGFTQIKFHSFKNRKNLAVPMQTLTAQGTDQIRSEGDGLHSGVLDGALRNRTHVNSRHLPCPWTRPFPPRSSQALSISADNMASAWGALSVVLRDLFPQIPTRRSGCRNQAISKLRPPLLACFATRC